MIRTALCGLIMLAAGLPYATGAGLAGTWEGSFTKGAAIINAGFDLDVIGDTITGAAFIQGWGYSTVSGGRLDGNQFYFMVDRQYTGNGPISKIEFSGMVRDKSMALAMIDGAKYETTLRRTESQDRAD